MSDFEDGDKPMLEYEPVDSEDEFVDGEAVEEDEEGAEEDEEDEEGQDAFVDDGFIVEDDVEDEEEEFEGSDEDGVRKKKKKKKKDKKRRSFEDNVEEDDLEDDLQLIEEAGIRAPRQDHRHKRLKKAGGEDSMMPEYSEMQQEDQIRHQLGLEEDEVGMMDLEDDVQMEGHPGDVPGDEEFYDGEQDDFIVYDNQGGMPNRGMDEGEGAMQRELQEIFGDYNQFLDYYKEAQRLKREKMELDLDLDAEMPEFDNEEDQQEWLHRQQEEKMQERRFKDIDPETAKRLFITPRDQEIRSTDLPERYMLNQELHLEDDAPRLNQDQCTEASVWIYNQLFSVGASSRLVNQLVREGRVEMDYPPEGSPVEITAEGEEQPVFDNSTLEGIDFDPKQVPGRTPPGYRVLRRARSDQQKLTGNEVIKSWYEDVYSQKELKKAIADVLEQIYVHYLEVPYIGMYCKEICKDLLSMRPEDCPSYTGVDDNGSRDPGGAFPQGAIQSHHRRARRFEVLDAILHWSYKYQNLINRRHILEDKYRACLAYASDAERAILEDCVDQLQDVTSADAIDDIQNRAQLMAVDAIGTYDDAQTSKKRPLKMRGMVSYRLPRDIGIGAIKEQIVLSASETGERLFDPVRQFKDVNSVPLDDLLMSMDLNSTLQRSREDRRKLVKQMAALELGFEPKVRQFMREQYSIFGCVDTCPTEQGKKILNAFHPLGRVKRLQSKPVPAFQGTDQWLRIQSAEKQGLITVKIRLQDDKYQEEVFGRFKEVYMSEGESAQTKEYNELREEIISQALEKYLLPMCTSHLKMNLESEAKEAVLCMIADKIWHYAITPPVRIKRWDADTRDQYAEDRDQFDHEDEHEEYVEHLRIMACCWGAGQKNNRHFGPPTTFVVLDPHGQLIDYMQCPQFSGYIPKKRDIEGQEYSMFEDEYKKEDAEKLRSMIVNHAPHLIVVGASGLDCRQLLDDLKQLVDFFLENHTLFLHEKLHETKTIDVQYLDPALAQLWEDSWVAKEEFKEYEPIIRRAIALGRLALDPLAVLCGLCGVGQEILKLRLHPQQSMLAEQEIMRMIENTLVSATSQVGVDVNRAAAAPWTSTPLQFVPGLGPRKAKALLEAIQRSHKKCLESRVDGLRGLEVVEANVFRNCAPYLRISSGGIHQLMDEGNFDLLDNTRIHPDHYDTTYKIAAAAQGGINDIRERDKQALIEYVFQHKSEVAQLDLVQAWSTNKVEDLSIMMDIQFELIQPYYDLRRRNFLDEKALFHLLTGESEDSFKEGKLVRARVLYVDHYQDKAKCLLEGNIEAWLHIQHVSKDKISRIGDRIQKQQQLDARILNINYKDVTVQITTASDALSDCITWEKNYCQGVDKFYMIEVQQANAQQKQDKDKDKDKDELANKVKSKKVIDRIITHPKFKNVSQMVAVEQLRSAEVGECLFRPHVKSTNYIQLSLKIFDGQDGPIVYHYDFREGKKGTGPNAHLKLGLPLSIKQLEPNSQEVQVQYEDLDEILARFVEPIVEVAKKLTSHRRFQDLYDEQLDNYVREERQRNPQQAAYALGLSQSKNGLVIIAFMTGQSRVHHDYMLIQRTGFYFRKRIFSKLDHALALFKKEPVVPRQGQSTSYNNMSSGSNQRHLRSGTVGTPMQQVSDSFYSGY